MTDEEFEAMLLEDGIAPEVGGDRLEQLIKLCAKYSECLDKKEELSIAEKTNNALIEEFSLRRLPTFMAELGIATQGLPNGQVIEINNIIQAKMPDKKEESSRYAKCVQWLDDHNLGDIVKREVVASFGKDSEDQVKRVIEEIRKATNGEIPVFEKSDVNYMTLNATLKKEAQKGRPLPKGDDGFDIYIGPRATFAKDKKSKKKKGSSE